MTPGQVAYEAWDIQYPKAPEVIPWNKLPEEYKETWQRVAQAVIEAYKRLNVVAPEEEK